MTVASHSELTEQHLRYLADQLSLQFGTVLFLSLAYVVCVAAFVTVLVGWRRAALSLFFIFGCVTFLVPCPLTTITSPAIALLAAAGIIWLSVRAKPKPA